jgi:hypothetical protein
VGLTLDAELRITASGTETTGTADDVANGGLTVSDPLVPSTDMDGTTRPQGTGVSMGAYEYSDTTW